MQTRTVTESLACSFTTVISFYITMRGNKYTSLRMSRNTRYSVDHVLYFVTPRVAKQLYNKNNSTGRRRKKNKTNLNLLQPLTTPKVNRHSRCHPSEKKDKTGTIVSHEAQASCCYSSNTPGHNYRDEPLFEESQDPLSTAFSTDASGFLKLLLLQSILAAYTLQCKDEPGPFPFQTAAIFKLRSPAQPILPSHLLSFPPLL